MIALREREEIFQEKKKRFFGLKTWEKLREANENVANDDHVIKYFDLWWHWSFEYQESSKYTFTVSYILTRMFNPLILSEYYIVKAIFQFI